MRATCSRRRARPFAAAFPSAVLAVDAAVHAQHSLLDEPWAGGVAVRVRMGTHTGEAVERCGDYFGSTLNRGNGRDFRCGCAVQPGADHGTPLTPAHVRLRMESKWSLTLLPATLASRSQTSLPNAFAQPR